MRKKSQPWSVDVWRLIAIFSLAASILMSLFIIYFFVAFKLNMSAFSSDVPVCWSGAKLFDGIAAAQAIGRLDFVSFLLAAGGLLFGLFALFGFWTVRYEVIERANDTAAEVAREVANFYYKKDDFQQTGRNGFKTVETAVAEVTGLSSDTGATNYDPATISVDGATEEKGAGDDEI